MSRKTYTFLAAVVLMSVAFGGCFAWSFLKVGYDNFSAYFNTFYNASVTFNDAMKDVKLSKQAYELSVIAGDEPAPFKISQQAKDNFTLTIVEASKVLQYHPHSEFTEDCLFMIGISYYYQDDNLRGERKFLEIESTFPNTKRMAEAEMYYGGMQLNGLQNETGRDRLFDAISLAREENKREVVAMSSDILSDYYLRTGDTLSAAAYLDTASTFSTGDDAAIYACRAGRLFSGAHEYSEAMKEFSRADQEAHDVEIRFYSMYYLARVHRLLGQYSQALGRLTELHKNDNFFDYFPLVEYQEATVLYDSGEVSKAVTAYERIDTAYTSSVAATRSAYRLANIYMYLVGDFQMALKYYQKVSSHPRVYSVTDYGQEMAKTLQDYMMSSYKVVLSDSLYYQVLNAIARNDTSVKYTQSRLDTLYEHAADARDELAGMFMFKLQIPDSAVRSYKIVLKDFPKSRVYPSALYSLGEYYYSSGDTVQGKEYLQELVNQHQGSPYAVSACSVLGIPPPVKVDSSQIRYSEAVSLTNKGEYGAAVDTLKELVQDKKAPLAPKALYTVGWIYENKLQIPDSAFKYYKRLSTEFPTSKYSKSIDLAVTGYETAQQDSARVKKARADSIAALRAKEEKADSIKSGKAGSIKIEKADSGKIEKMDSNKIEKRSAVKIEKADSAEIEKLHPAKIEKADSNSHEQAVDHLQQPELKMEKKPGQSSDTLHAPVKMRQDSSRIRNEPSKQNIRYEK